MASRKLPSEGTDEMQEKKLRGLGPQYKQTRWTDLDTYVVPAEQQIATGEVNLWFSAPVIKGSQNLPCQFKFRKAGMDAAANVLKFWPVFLEQYK